MTGTGVDVPVEVSVDVAVVVTVEDAVVDGVADGVVVSVAVAVVVLVAVAVVVCVDEALLVAVDVGVVSVVVVVMHSVLSRKCSQFPFSETMTSFSVVFDVEYSRHRLMRLLWLKLLHSELSMHFIPQSAIVVTCDNLNPSWYAGRPRTFVMGPLNRYRWQLTCRSVAVVVAVLVSVVVAVDVSDVVGVLLWVDVPVVVGDDVPVVVAVEVPDVVAEEVAELVPEVVGVVTWQVSNRPCANSASTSLIAVAATAQRVAS